MLSPGASELKFQMLSALTRELAIARKSSAGERTNQAKDGVRTRKKGGSFLYEFEELSGFPPDEGVEISFTVGAESTMGRFLGEINSKFVFELRDDIGAKIGEASVVSDPLFLLSKQINILTTDTPFENQVALASLGLADFGTARRLNLNETFMEGLNALQVSTLSVVADKPVTYIWGPPGTGKTTTMGSIVAALANSGQKVLLVSNTNLALDTALERCLDRYADSQEMGDGLMLRLGTMVKAELISKYSKKIDLDNLAEKASAPLRKRIEKTSIEIQKSKNRLSDLTENLRAFQRHLESSRASLDVRSKLTSQNLELSKLAGDLYNFNSEANDLDCELSESSARSSLSRIFSKHRNPGAIQIDIRSIKSKVDQTEKSIQRISSEISRLQGELGDVELRAKKSLLWLQKNPESAALPEKIESITLEVTSKELEIKALQEEISRKRVELLSRSRVVACTAYRPLLDKDIIGMSFDCVVVDEVSMLPLPLYFCTAHLAQSRIVVAGDFRQLPPIVRVGASSSPTPTPEEISDKKLREMMTDNAFTKSGIITDSNHGKKSAALIALRDQYRMREQISDLISETFYPDHTLRTAGEMTDKPTPWGNEPFIFFDTHSLEPESSTVNNRSRRNIVHALTVQAIAKRLLEDGWELSSTGDKSFGIVSPYAKQASFISGLLSTDPATHIKGGVSTVHRFQGNERDLMIIDLTKVASNSDPSLGSFIGHPDPLAPENAMWNVAISRARQHVIFVADSATLDLNSSSLIVQLFRKMQKNMARIDAKTIIDTEILTKQAPRSAKGSLAWFSDSSFYQGFQIDLESAKGKVLLASPFTTLEGTERWMQTFRDLHAKDVEIVGLTKPIEEKDLRTGPAALHANLETVFKELRLVSKMHEKLAVIDQRIVWLGSLNILSHKNASELMVRIESPDFAQSIIEEYQSNRFNRARPPKPTPAEMRARSGTKCQKAGCNGDMEIRPAGFSRRTGKTYEAFLSCSAYMQTGCKGY